MGANRWAVASILALLAITAGAQTTTPPVASSNPAAGVRNLDLAVKPWSGDFDAMRERRVIRFLVPYSRTLYFNDKGHERGLSAELARDFERYINKRYADQLDKKPITVYLIPTTRDKLLSNLAAGLGDISAGNLTVTDEREKIVDFVAPTDSKPIHELIVTGPKSPPIGSLDDLAGKQVYTRKSSSYYESLTALNGHFNSAGKPPMQIALLPDALEDEDVLEMLNAGLLDIVVVDDWKAKMWAQVLPHVKVREDLVVRGDGHTGWAIRKGSPQLQAVLNDFYVDDVKKQGPVAAWLSQYMKQIRQISDNTDSAERQRFDQTLALFEKYGKQYSFDPLMLAAQCYQESQPNQKAHNHMGAAGVVQIRRVGGKKDAHSTSLSESSIHADAQYMDQMMSQYFPDAHFNDTDRALFAFASYDAGPANIAKMRKEAAARGLNPDKWFNNVEIVVAQNIGIETTTYVRDVYKYYAAYRLVINEKIEKRRAMEQMHQEG
jgi:membrane-bound lytic murein transglycosylase MltF